MSKKIDTDRLITPSAYAKLIGVTPAAITKQMKKPGFLEVIKIKGGRLIVLTDY